VIIGAMKSGTTSLYQYLGRHPSVTSCELRKQVDFFSDDALWERGLDWYCDQCSFDPADHSWALEASPSYTNPKSARKSAERMASVEAAFRLIYLMRDPFDRIRSHFHHWKKNDRFEEGLSLSRALRTRPQLLGVTRYGKWLEVYRDHFPADRIHLLTLEHLAESPEAVLEEVCRFLEIDAEFQFPNLGKRYNTRDVHGEYGWTYHLLRSIGPLREAVRKAIPLDVRNRLKKVFKKDDDDGDEYPELSAFDRAYIREQLADDLERLDRDPQVDVSRWKAFDDEASSETASQ